MTKLPIRTNIYYESKLATLLTEMMEKALEAKDVEAAKLVEELGRLLECIGLFQKDKKVLLPFSTCNYKSKVSTYIDEGMGDMEYTFFNPKASWGIPNEDLWWIKYGEFLDAQSEAEQDGDLEAFDVQRAITKDENEQKKLEDIDKQKIKVLKEWIGVFKETKLSIRKSNVERQ